MSRPTVLHALAVLVLALAVIPSSSAAASGGRIDEWSTSSAGIADPTRDAHIYALPYDHSTTVIRTYEDDDRQADIQYLDWTLQVPAVAQDLGTAGLSADGSTLVLSEVARGDSGETRFLVLDANRLRPRENIRLGGDFAFDSISPDGSTLYLVRYLDPRDPYAYEVRAYDLEAEQLLPEPIIDRRLAPRVMAGTPLTRAYSPGGAWAYTLYDGGYGRHAEPFVHALDTVNGRALCIDLPMFAHGKTDVLWSTKLVPDEDGSSIALVDRKGATLATIDTGTWEVVEGAPERAEAPTEADESGVGALPIAAAAGTVALCSLALAGRVTRRREP
jgi:hypothetical protein